tara:strand:- start:159 stop:2162 length:2004 start_codon:yes stop_codon:yes gene_type:complete
MADLNAVIQQLKDNKKSTEDVESAVNRLTGQFSTFLNQGKTAKLKGLEAAAESRSPVSKSTSSKSGGGPGLLGGLMGGAKFAGLAGLAGLAAAQFLDGAAIKKNVENILSIGERYSEDTLKTFLSDGAVVLALIGLGKGLIAFGIGAGVNAAVEYFSDGTTWSENVKTNVTNLLSIADDYTLAGLGVLFDGTGVTAALAGLGVGLTAFSAGSALGISTDAYAQWAGATDWATNIKTNVQELLSIADGFGENMDLLFTGTGIFPLAMTGLAAGLGVFGVGSALAIGSDAFAKWTGSEKWAENLKGNVVTLLSIKDNLGGNWQMLKDNGAFVLAMTGIGIGLGTFGAGAILAGGTDMLGDWFATGTNWAQHVKDNVETLLSIAVLPNVGVDTAKFAAVMGGIAAGLLAFATAGGATSIVDVISDWISPGEGRQNWTEEVKKNVKNILSIVDDDVVGEDQKSKLDRAKDFAKVMGSISLGLTAFAGANFVTGLTNAAEAILSFFTGQDNAFDEVMKIAEKADDLEKGANAVDSLTLSIEKLGRLKFDGSTIRMKAFAEDLAAAVPVIEKAIMGGKFDDSWLPFTEQEIKGLADPSIDYDTAIMNIANLRQALALPNLSGTAGDGGGGGGGGGNTTSYNDNSVRNSRTDTSLLALGNDGNDNPGNIFKFNQ